jgi:hypothetical protein
MPNPFQSQHTVVLPVSGARVRVRRPSLMTMVTVSGLPTELTSLAMKVANGQRVLESGDEPDIIKANFAAIEAYIPFVLVDLKVTKDGPTDVHLENHTTDGAIWVGTVNLADLPDIDKQYLFMYGRHLVSPNEPDTEADIEPAKEATPEEIGQFRDGAAGDDAGSSGEAVRAEAVESTRHSAREPVIA